MNVYRSIKEIPYQADSLITIGTFDGIHRGHRSIIDNVVHEANQDNARSVLVTFFPHPQTVVRGDGHSVALLTPVEEKIEILRGLGLHAVLIIPFTRQLSRMEPKDFIEQILVRKVGVCKFVMGFNHAFGKDRSGGSDLFQRMGTQHGFTVETVPPVRVDDNAVSSTRIRKLLLDGQIVRANTYLGWNYRIRGVVKEGERVGRKLGFPTANIDVLGDNKLIPGDGVYAVFVRAGEESFKGMVNVGFRPTVSGTHRVVEAHIHEYEGDLYGKELHIEFIDRLRDEKQFDSVEALVDQIAKDQKKTIERLSKFGR